MALSRSFRDETSQGGPMVFRAQHKPLFRVAALLLILIVALQAYGAAGVSAQTPPAPPAAQPAPPPADLLSFVTDILPQRQRDLWVMRVDGTDKRQLTRGFNVWFASWSPEGKRIAVTTEAGQIFTVNADGSNLKLIAGGAYSPPFWSPDGHFIAYV